MTNTYFEHPAEDALERYLMHHSDEQEIEFVETHTLACESCVQRLEALEINIAATKLALQELHQEQTAKAYAQAQQGSWRRWLTAPRLSFAGAALVLALATGITVPRLYQGAATEQLSLYDYRGQESPSIAKGHPLDVNLNANGLNDGEVNIQLVSETGNKLWEGASAVQNGRRLQVRVPAIHSEGIYYFRLFTPGSQNELREFAFKAR